MALVVSLVIAASLGLMLYAVTSLTFISSEPLADPRFGPQNACALKELREGRTGFAVGPDGAVAVFSGASIVHCAPGDTPSARVIELSGVTSAAIDFSGALWIARRNAQATELYKLPPDAAAPEIVGELSPIALVGHAKGVLVLESQGRVVSLATDGSVLAVWQLPNPPHNDVELAPNSDGTLVSVTAGGGVFVLDAVTLERVRAESPCAVEFSWWLERSDDLLLSCGPDGSFSLKLNARTGDREEARPQTAKRSVRVPKLGHYVEDCGDLPCTTKPPI